MIKNLQPQLNEYGRIKIGIKGDSVTTKQGKEFRLPQKIDHFILTTTEKSEDGDFLPDTALMDRIKENNTGMVNEQGNLIGIPIRLLYDDTEQNFPTRYACYNGKNCSCYGDGQTAFKRLDEYKKEYPCPCPRLDSDYEGKDRCKPNGRLVCMIDEAGLFGQAHVFRTTSINSIKGIWAGIELIKVATKGRVAGLPLMLVLTSKQTDHGPVYIVSVCYRGTMDNLRDSVRELAIKERDYLLDIPVLPQQTIVEPNTEEESDFVEEFYPDAAMEPSSPGIKLPEKEKPTQKPIPEEEIPEAAKPYILENQNSYAKIYNRFVIALATDEREEAFKLSKRMTREYLAMFFENVRPDIEVPENAKKTELLAMVGGMLDEDSPLKKDPPKELPKESSQAKEPVPEPALEPEVKSEPKTKRPPEVIAFFDYLSSLETQKEVADAMEKAFSPLPINRSLDRLSLIKAAKRLVDQGHFKSEQGPRTEPEISKEPTQKFAAFDPSDPIETEQLRALVKIKAKLERAKITQPEDWRNFIRNYLVGNGNPANSATQLSRNQGDELIASLNNRLPETDRVEYDSIPF